VEIMSATARRPVECFGRVGGRPVIYHHGTPGAPVEARFLEAAALGNDIELWAVDRAAVAPDAAGERYLSALVDLVVDLSGGERVPMLGFSIGAAFALRIASRMGDRAGPLFLLSAAAPLDAPGAFDGMGGGAAVFRTARRNGHALGALVRLQASMAHGTPALLQRLLFAGAHSSDRRFARDPSNGNMLRDVYRRAFADGGGAYRRDLLAYVDLWSGELGRIASRVELWHGHADNWAPIAMAYRIAAQLPRSVGVHEIDAGHYAALIGSADAAIAAIRQWSDEPGNERQAAET
jgi:pimeloyl-ACP methyl ester carboxylesterase